MSPAPESTLVVILGASEFPKSPQLGASKALRNSAQAIQDYLRSKDGFGLPDANLHDLFDSPSTCPDQDESLGNWLKSRIADMKESQVPATDLLLYYVGHGGFFSPNDQYFLALRNTRESYESVSGYPIKSLANTLKENAGFLRRFLILDCCFSAKAYEAFQSAPLQVAQTKTREELPEKGTCLLCASGPRDPAKVLPGMIYTMFSGVLLDVLKNGAVDLPERLSLADVGARVIELIRERHRDLATRPQVLSPDQNSGDLAHFTLFPNPGLRAKVLNETLERLQQALDQILEKQKSIESDHLALRTKVDVLGEVVKNPPDRDSAETGGTGPAGEGAVLSAPQPVTERDRERQRRTGLTRAEWDEIPSSVKSDVLKYLARRQISRYWLMACIAIVFTNWTFSIWAWMFTAYNYSGPGVRNDSMPSGGPASPAASHAASDVVSSGRTLRPIADGLTAVSGVMLVIQFLGTAGFLTRTIDVVGRAGAEPEFRPWENYDIIIEAKNYSWVTLRQGLEVGSTCVSLTFILYSVTFLGTLVIRVSPYLR